MDLNLDNSLLQWSLTGSFKSCFLHLVSSWMDLIRTDVVA